MLTDFSNVRNVRATGYKDISLLALWQLRKLLVAENSLDCQANRGIIVVTDERVGRLATCHFEKYKLFTGRECV